MWPGTRESTLNQNSVSCSRLMMRTSRSAPVPSALQAEEPLPPCKQCCRASAALWSLSLSDTWCDEGLRSTSSACARELPDAYRRCCSIWWPFFTQWCNELRMTVFARAAMDAARAMVGLHPDTAQLLEMDACSIGHRGKGQGTQSQSLTLILVSTTLRTPGAAAWCSHCAFLTLLALVMIGENRWLRPVPLQDRLQPCTTLRVLITACIQSLAHTLHNIQNRLNRELELPYQIGIQCKSQRCPLTQDVAVFRALHGLGLKSLRQQ